MSDVLRSNKKIYIHIIYNSGEKNSTPTHATTVLLWNQEQWWIPSILMNYNSSDGSIVSFRFWLQIKREKRAIIYERAVSIMIWTDFKEKIGKLIRRNIHRKYHRVYRRMQENEKSNIGITYINNFKKKRDKWKKWSSIQLVHFWGEAGELYVLTASESIQANASVVVPTWIAEQCVLLARRSILLAVLGTRLVDIGFFRQPYATKIQCFEYFFHFSTNEIEESPKNLPNFWNDGFFLISWNVAVGFRVCKR